MKKSFSRSLAMMLAVVLVIGMLPLSILAAETAACTVSGNVPGSGSITATNADGEAQVFENALVNGSYSIDLAEGTYSLYFDCGDYEGLIPNVAVSGDAVTASLDKTYQKLTSFKYGSAGTANWVLTDNGKYAVQTSNDGGDTIAMGWFESDLNLATTDFVIETNVQAAGTSSVMIGLALDGKNAAGTAETAVFGLGNNNNFAQIRAIRTNGWPGYKSVAAYDKTNFALKIVKQGTTVTYYINGTQACQWTTSDYNFAGWTETKVGLGFYRMYDVTFSDYSYSRINTVSGSVAGNASGNVTATDAKGEETVFEGALVDGSYSIELTDGTYDLYFDCGTQEGMLNDVVVSGADVTANLDKTYQKLSFHKEGVAGAANWVMTENGRYEVQTNDGNDNTISMGYFAENVDMSTTNFVIRTNVEAAGTTNVMIGLALSGKNLAGNSDSVVFGLINNANNAIIHSLNANEWPGWKDLSQYNKTNFELTIVKGGDNISYFIDGVKACQWYTSDYNFNGWTDVKVGFGIYRTQDVIFSNYSYTEDISAMQYAAVTYGELPEGVSVSVNNNAMVLAGQTITVSGLTNEDMVYTVKVNGQQILQSNGTAQFVATEDSTIEVTATAKVTSFTVSGTAPGNGTVIATGENGEEILCALENGSYSMVLPNGTYDLYFDCGDYEGLISDVVVNGAEVTANLDKTYIKLTPYKEGLDGTAEWVLADNGRYEVQTSNSNVNAVAMGVIDTIADLDAVNFEINTHVEAAGTNPVMLGLVLNGTNAAGNRDVAVYGLNNSNQTGQIRALLSNGWPGYRNLPNSYDRTSFDLKIVKEGNLVTYYIDGVFACTWYADEYSIAGWTDVSIGLGFYRMYDVTFSEYSYEASYAVSGSVPGSGSVTATNAAGEKFEFQNALVDGSYSVILPNGTYDLYFDCGTHEGMINDVVVNGDVVTADLDKTYQKLTSLQIGVDGTADWNLTENGRYEVVTSNTSANTVSMAYFADGVDLSTTDFVIETNVEAAGTKAVLLGLVINSDSETVVYGLNNSNQSGQIRVLMANGWPGYKNIASYDRTNFALKIVKLGTTVTYYINGAQACQWTASDYDFSSWTSAKVGLGFYRMYDVTFSDYSYTVTNLEALDTSGNVIAAYGGFADAAEDVATGGISSYRLIADLEDQVISKDMILDLNGHSLTNVTVNQGVTLQLIDSTTDDFTGEYGHLSGTIEGTVNSLVEFGGKSYLVACEDGVYSAHCYEVELTHVSLDPKNDALGYKAILHGDEIVCKYVTGIGFNLWVDGGKTVTRTMDFNGDQEITLRLKNILACNGGEMTINGNAFVIINGTTVTSDDYGTTMRSVLETVNNGFDGYSTAQKNAVKELVDTYADKMTDWAIDAIKTWEISTEG